MLFLDELVFKPEKRKRIVSYDSNRLFPGILTTVLMQKRKEEKWFRVFF